MKLPDDTLYLPIKQVYFDAIIAGTKRTEYRQVCGYPLASRYLIKEEGPNHYKLNPECTKPGQVYDWRDYNGGRYPFLPRPFKRLYMAVGYEKDRDTATVEITSITFHPEQVIHDRDGIPAYCFWVMEIHLGKVLEVYRKERVSQQTKRKKQDRVELKTDAPMSERIELTPIELEVLELCARREFSPNKASVDQQDAEISLIEKARALEDSDPTLLDERMEYTRDCNLLIWYWYRYQLQEGKCSPWGGKQTDL